MSNDTDDVIIGNVDDLTCNGKTSVNIQRFFIKVLEYPYCDTDHCCIVVFLFLFIFIIIIIFFQKIATHQIFKMADQNLPNLHILAKFLNFPHFCNQYVCLISQIYNILCLSVHFRLKLYSRFKLKSQYLLI